MAKSLVVVAAIMSVTSLACGGSGGAGDGGIFWGSGGSGGGGGTSCGTFTPCGGSVVGTWKITDFCMSTPDAGAPRADAACSTTGNNMNLKYGGTVTFRYDGTYTADLAVSGSESVTYSAGCFSSGYSCSAMDSIYKSPGVADAGMSGSCMTGSSGSCTCSVAMNTDVAPMEGTYTTSGTTITMTSGSDSEPDQSDYCVQGNRLTLRQSSSSGQSSTIVATK